MTISGESCTTPNAVDITNINAVEIHNFLDLLIKVSTVDEREAVPMPLMKNTQEHATLLISMPIVDCQGSLTWHSWYAWPKTTSATSTNRTLAIDSCRGIESSGVVFDERVGDVNMQPMAQAGRSTNSVSIVLDD